MKIYSKGGSIKKLRKNERDFIKVSGCTGKILKERLKERERGRGR